MYPEFEHELAMALGDEFDEHNINAYQLADFSDTCQLPRALVTNRWKQLIRKLMAAVADEINMLSLDEKEKEYVEKYQEIILERCKHLLKQSNEIRSTQL